MCLLSVVLNRKIEWDKPFVSLRIELVSWLLSHCILIIARDIDIDIEKHLREIVFKEKVVNLALHV